MKEFLQLIFGTVFSGPMIAAMYFFALVGISINLLHHANTRNPQSPNTPEKFSKRFLLWDNRRRIAMDVLVLFVTIRFLPIIANVDALNTEAVLIAALLVGLGFDKGVERLQAIKGSFLKVKRDPPAGDNDKG